jgi:hypothetical protein
MKFTLGHATDDEGKTYSVYIDITFHENSTQFHCCVKGYVYVYVMHKTESSTSRCLKVFISTAR